MSRPTRNLHPVRPEGWGPMVEGGVLEGSLSPCDLQHKLAMFHGIPFRDRPRVVTRAEKFQCLIKMQLVPKGNFREGGVRGKGRSVGGLLRINKGVWQLTHWRGLAI